MTSIIEQFFGSGSGIANVKDNITFLRRQAEEIHDYGVYDKARLFDILKLMCSLDNEELESNIYLNYVFKASMSRIFKSLTEIVELKSPDKMYTHLYSDRHTDRSSYIEYIIYIGVVERINYSSPLIF